MRNRELGWAGVAVAVTVAVAACGSGGSGKTGGGAAGTHPAALAPTATPAPPKKTGPFSADELQAALLDPAAWGTGWHDVQDGPLVKTAGLGTIAQIPDEDCSAAVYYGTRAGSRVAVEDIVDSGHGDIAHQDAYQFGPGDAARVLTATAKKINDCGTFHYTDDNGSSFVVQAHSEPVPGLGDQAVRSVIEAVNPRSGTDVDAVLLVRYGDVVIDVGYDSAIATTATSYDLTGRATAIAAKLGLTSAGS